MYGERKCIMCGTKFEAAYASQVTCTAECMKLRRKKTKALWSFRRNMKLQECEKMAEQIATLKQRVKDLEARLVAMGQDI